VKLAGAIALLGLGVLAIGFGLLFLVGAGGRGGRYAVAATGLSLGALAVAAGIALGRAAAREAPARIEGEILALARRRSGEVSAADVGAALGARAALGDDALRRLVARGSAREERRADGTYYLFEGLLARLVVRRCAYCDFEGPLSDDVGECPKCGGDMKTSRVAETVSAGELYSMDE